jgi:hypothetical protein
VKTAVKKAETTTKHASLKHAKTVKATKVAKIDTKTSKTEVTKMASAK